jgi:hypothetical protein
MGLADILRGSVAIAATVVDDVRVNVTHEVWTGQSGLGVPTYSAGVVRRALVSPTSRRVLAQDGRIVVATHRLLFLDAAPVSPKDKLTLPDGTHPPLLEAHAPPLTADGRALCWTVYLGMS